ncbi:Hint domain-containing protein [Paracoccus sp. SCSIO 75233]|uniref:Hint domain-containing protein n=1 Tax=Paracoccus sp. SCSIO 75233 TaxID=3017782 RepID=UPI0022F120B8|nr:Hint domain-containing protein [Paracoccus sp. SCSIO 75233]WBU53207.1 Hint domain-containing protein [Paracoccus sp. SCSIO 75233]
MSVYNLITNPEFDQGLNGWQTDGNVSHNLGYNTVTIDGGSKTGGGYVWQDIDVRPGKLYGFSCFFGLSSVLAANETMPVSIKWEITAVPEPGSSAPPEVYKTGSASDSRPSYNGTTGQAADVFIHDNFTMPAGVTKVRVKIYLRAMDTNRQDAVLGKVAFGSVVCFSRGALIETDTGERAVETLQAGDLVKTLGNGLQPIRWIGHKKLNRAALRKNPKLRPILIRKDALGPGSPRNDLVVSPQHRMLVSSEIVHRVFGENQVLVPACKLLPIDGVSVVEDDAPVEYWHFLCDDHQIVKANGALTETLLLGPEALKTMSGESLEEINAIFPEHSSNDVAVPAAEIADGRRCRKMIARHLKHEKCLIPQIGTRWDNMNQPVKAELRKIA